MSNCSETVVRVPGRALALWRAKRPPVKLHVEHIELLRKRSVGAGVLDGRSLGSFRFCRSTGSTARMEESEPGTVVTVNTMLGDCEYHDSSGSHALCRKKHVDRLFSVRPRTFPG
jgi:hypothetical protein